MEIEAVLRTKLNRPGLPPDLVARERLLARLNAARTLPLILVSAPPGYGKSTLVARWLERIDWPGVWVSLDAQDGELRRFTEQLIAGLRTAFPNACPETLALLAAPKPLPPRALRTTLANEIESLPDPFTLVLDDYHHIDADSPVNELLGALLEHPPLPLHLVLISRRDPPLPLLGLRARGQLAEVRMADLRFDPGETRELLDKAAGFTASADALGNVERELEGWGVGLRLVSLALRANSAPNETLANLRGGLHQTQEYLFQQVLARQPVTVRDWLLSSAVLDGFCAGLCEAVCGGGCADADSPLDGPGFIRAITEGNLFVIPLDAQGEWFRYHHLFRALLQGEMAKSIPAPRIAALHGRASAWFAARGLVDEALQQALAAGDPKGAADLVGQHFVQQLNEGRWFVVDRWLALLPPGERQRADVLAAEGWVLYEKFQLANLDRIVEQADALADDAQPEPTRGFFSFFRGLLAHLQADYDCARKYLEQAKACFASRQNFSNGLVELWLALARCANGETTEAIRALESELRGRAASADAVTARLVVSLFFVHYISGDLAPARREAVRLVAVGQRGAGIYVEAWARYLEGLTWLQAADAVRATEPLAGAARHVQILHVRAALDTLACLALARQLDGRPVDAAEALDRLQEFAREVGESAALDVAASSRARLALLRGQDQDALEWARTAKLELPAPIEMISWLDVPLITQARVLIVRGNGDDVERALQVLAAALEMSRASGYRQRLVEIRMLQALGMHRQGDDEAALHAVREAIRIGAAGGWLLPFVETGSRLTALLDHLEKADGRIEFVTLLRAALRKRADAEPAGVPAPSATGALAGLSLTRRERQMLGFLAQRLQNKEIAARLFVSPETVKSHLKNLYQKLGVGSRREASVRALEIIGKAPVAGGPSADVEPR